MSAPGSAHLRTVETCGFRRLLTHKRAPIFPQPGLKNGVTQLRSSPSQLPAPACPIGNVAVLGASERRELAVLFPEGRHFFSHGCRRRDPRIYGPLRPAAFADSSLTSVRRYSHSPG